MSSGTPRAWFARASSTAAAWWRRRVDSLRDEPVIAALTIALVCLGLALRARGYFVELRAFWLDECAWAIHLMKHGYAGQYLRPLGFMAVSEAAASLFSPSERVLRALPWFSGAATVILSPLLAKRLFSSGAARLLFVAILALHPSAIDLSNEFKPYSVSLFLHVLLLFLTLRYLSLGRTKDLAAVLAVAFIGPLFAQDTVFAFPGTFLVLGWDAYRRKRSHLGFIALVAVTIVVALGAQYFFIWRAVSHEEASYWGNKYDVFYTGHGRQSHLAWFFEKQRELAAFPGSRREFWQPDGFSKRELRSLRGYDSALWVVLHLAGLARLIWKKRFTELLLAVLPFVVLWSFNTIEFWPSGAFRTNLFVLCYSAVIASSAFDWPLAGWARHLSPLVPASLVVVPLLAFETNWHEAKRAGCKDGRLPATLDALVEERSRERQPGREPLLIDQKVCAEWTYYSHLHPDRATLVRKVDRYFDVRCNRVNFSEDLHRAAKGGVRVWALLFRSEKAEVLARAPDGKTLDILENTDDSPRVAVFREPHVDGAARRRGSSSRRPR